MADPIPQPTTPAPNLSGLSQSGTAVLPPPVGNPDALTTPAPAGAPEQAILEGNMQGAADQRQQAATEMAKPLPSAPHARLLQMIQGLSAAVAGSGAQWASRGKVSGAEVTNQILAQEAQQRENQQKLAMEQKQQDVQNHLAIGASNEATANMMMNLMSLKQRMTQSDLEMKGETQTQAINLADFVKQNFGFTPEQLTGTATANPDQIKMGKSMLQRAIGPDSAAITILPKDSPALKAAQTVLDDPNATPGQVSSAGNALDIAVKNRQTAQGYEAKGSVISQRTDLFAKLNTNPKLLDDPSTQARLQGILNDPNSTPDQIKQANSYMKQASSANEQYLAQQTKLAEARGAAYGANRPVNVIDEQGVERVMRAGDAFARGLSPVGATKAMSQAAQIADIQTGSNSLRQSILENRGSEFTTDQEAKLTLALSAHDPTVMTNEIKNLMASKLTPAQQDLVTDLAQMQERVLSVRNIAGMGQGSEQTRNAILATVPGIASGNTTMALKQLDAVDNFITNLQKGVPKANLATPIAAGAGLHSNTAPASGKAVSLQAAMALPINKGKTADQVRADIEAHGHQVTQ